MLQAVKIIKEMRNCQGIRSAFTSTITSAKHALESDEHYQAQ